MCRRAWVRRLPPKAKNFANEILTPDLAGRNNETRPKSHFQIFRPRPAVAVTTTSGEWGTGLSSAWTGCGGGRCGWARPGRPVED
jgi:hypothetical protein